MRIQMTGIDHNLAGVEVRERFSFTSAGAAKALLRIYSREDIAGCVLLSTCNRTELWASTLGDKPVDLLPLLCDCKDLPYQDYAPYFVHRQGQEAVRYLFELASGLRSRVLGEDQILTQVKEALAQSREAQCCGSVLEVLFRNAVTGAKKIKAELNLSTANASAAELAVAWLKQQGMPLAGKRCLVIGNGEMGKRTAAALLAQGADVTVTVRQYHSGVVEVLPGCRRIDYGKRYTVLPQCDLVVSATRSPNVTLRRDDVAACGLSQPTVFLDLAVPRDIDPGVAQLPLATLYGIDLFAAPESRELLKELQRARMLLQQQEEKFLAWYECRDLIPRVDKLGRYLAQETTARVAGDAQRLGITEEQRGALTQLLEASAGKVLKKLLFSVRDEAGAEVLRSCVEAMEQVTEHE
ncbi:MAG TPA: glutamyl-tRNA reductase [Candidatus Gallacutalibacter stercoravium]|nr:glutamyl-tRNA reductase [Candidatus Gallacutalibacter stercoravium]